MDGGMGPCTAVKDLIDRAVRERECAERAILILTRARGLLGRKRGWTQGVAHRVTRWGNDSFCSLGAIDAASKMVDRREKSPSRTLAAAALHISAYGGLEPGYNVMHWNDYPGRTQEEVLLAFDKAIELLKTS